MVSADTWTTLLSWIFGALFICPALLSTPISFFLEPKVSAAPQPSGMKATPITRYQTGLALQFASIAATAVAVLMLVDACPSCFMLWGPVALLALAVCWGLCAAGFAIVLSEWSR
jgi:hypothetical protein